MQREPLISLAALFVYALSPMEINIPLLAHGLLRTRGIFPLLGEEPYRAIISASLRQCPLVPRVVIPTAAYALGGVPMSAHFVRVI